MGIIILQIIDVHTLSDSNVNWYFGIKGILTIFYDLGSWAIIWHISFKYWETARQFSRMVRVYQAQDANQKDNVIISTNTGNDSRVSDLADQIESVEGTL